MEIGQKDSGALDGFVVDRDNICMFVVGPKNRTRPDAMSNFTGLGMSLPTIALLCPVSPEACGRVCCWKISGYGGGSSSNKGVDCASESVSIDWTGSGAVVSSSATSCCPFESPGRGSGIV